MVAQLRPWVQRLSLSAMPRWIPHLAAGMQCHVATQDPSNPGFQRCTNVGCGPCVFCRQTTCLEHSFVAGSGELICFACVAKHPAAQGNADPPPRARAAEPSQAEIVAAYKVLGIPKDAWGNWEAVNAAYKKRVLKAHPDQGGSAEKFRKIQGAYELLKKVHNK